jgi:hypothetical protein
MNVTSFETGFFPFLVPEMGSSFASSTGAQTVYPAGFSSLDQVMQIYWRAKDYLLVANGSGAYGGVSQVLAINGNLPPRNTVANTSTYSTLTGFAPTGPADLVCGRGLRQVVPGSGTITASGGAGSGSGAALFNLQVNLFYPEIFAPNPVVRFNNLWWPALSVSCQVTNTVTLAGGGELELAFDCTTLPDASSTTALGTFSFFGVAVPVFCTALAPASGPDPAETRTFSGTLTVADEWA